MHWWRRAAGLSGVSVSRPVTRACWEGGGGVGRDAGQEEACRRKAERAIAQPWDALCLERETGLQEGGSAGGRAAGME